MLPDYLVIGTTEIVNTARADGYGAGAGDCGLALGCLDCPDLVRVVNNGLPYTDITTAPWYDTAVPESARVYGYTGLEVNGLDEMVWASPGGSDEAPTGVVRDFEWVILVAAADDCAMDYALGWLASALNDPVGGAGGCSGQTACMVACCPTDPSQDVIRNIFGVRTLEGPRVVQRAMTAVGAFATVSVTLRTPYPQIYREPKTWTVRPVDGTVVDVDLPAIYEDCPDPQPCTTDPDCPRPAPPAIPSVPMDDCYPAEFTAKRLLLSIPAGAVPSGLDSVLVAEVYTGATPVRNFVLRVHNNPYGVPCDRLPNLNPCRACTDLVVTYIPPGGGLSIDGRTKTETVWCGTGNNRAQDVPVVYGTPRAPFVHPVWACGGGTCIEILTDQTVGADVTVDISLVPRQEMT